MKIQDTSRQKGKALAKADGNLNPGTIHAQLCDGAEPMNGVQILQEI